MHICITTVDDLEEEEFPCLEARFDMLQESGIEISKISILQIRHLKLIYSEFDFGSVLNRLLSGIFKGILKS